MRDQRGSKVMEKVMVLLRQVAEEEIANPGSQFGSQNNRLSSTTSDDKLANGQSEKNDGSTGARDEDEFTVVDALSFVKTLLRSLAGDAFENSTNCYASHSAQSLLGLVPLYISIESRIFAAGVKSSPGVDLSTDMSSRSDPTDGLENGEDSEMNEVLSLEDTFLYFFGVIR